MGKIQKFDTMESENGVAVVEEKHVIGEATKKITNKEVKNDCDNAETQAKNEASKPIIEAEDANSTSAKTAVEANRTSSASKNSKHAKEHSGRAGISSKNNKSTKDKPNLKGPTLSSQIQRPTLSQSLSFPPKSACGDAMKKSFDRFLVKTETKLVQGNRIRLEASFHHSNRSINSEVNSKEAKSNPGNPNQKTSLTSMTSFKRYAFGRSITVNAVSKSHTSETSIPPDLVSNSAKTAKPNKEEDDAHSTTSSATPSRRNSGSGFSFRLEERAERRKEFFSKLEEKIQVKEAEKTNQQEKSKENQEAEIKQLRKSLTFKATPMPSFYREPPPKVELKKIPTTRAISPKLGRHKGCTVNNNNSEDKPCSSSHGKQQQNDSTKAKVKGYRDVISKKPIRKNQAKLQSQATVISKTESDSVNQDAKTYKGSSEECQDPPIDNSEYQHEMELESEKDLVQNNALVLNSLAPEIVSCEVAVRV